MPGHKTQVAIDALRQMAEGEYLTREDCCTVMVAADRLEAMMAQTRNMEKKIIRQKAELRNNWQIISMRYWPPGVGWFGKILLNLISWMVTGRWGVRAVMAEESLRMSLKMMGGDVILAHALATARGNDIARLTDQIRGLEDKNRELEDALDPNKVTA